MYLFVCNCVEYQVQTQSLVDTCHRFTKRILVQRVTEAIRVPQWNQQHQVSEATSNFYVA